MERIQGEFELINKKQLSETCFDFLIYSPELVKISQAGQFIHILCGEKTLRRPISICEIDAINGTLRIVFEVRGEGTLWLSKQEAGNKLDILGSLGNGFPLCLNKKAMLVGGGIGVPPLLECAKRYLGEATAVLGFRSEENAILINDFERLCKNTYVTTNDGTLGHKGFVTDVMKEVIAAEKIEVIYACGPTPMLKAIGEVAKSNLVECYVSLEERMGCGVGACLVCACKTKKNGEEEYSHVCKNGPVFNIEEVVW